MSDCYLSKFFYLYEKVKCLIVSNTFGMWNSQYNQPLSNYPASDESPHRSALISAFEDIGAAVRLKPVYILPRILKAKPHRLSH